MRSHSLCLLFQFDNRYIVLMQASSSGGTGPYSNPLVFTFGKSSLTHSHTSKFMSYYLSIESPPTPTPSTEALPTSDFNLFTSWMFYAISIPSLIVLVVIVSLLIVCCKKHMSKGSRQVSYVRGKSCSGWSIV